jgi:hypothetical protein
VNSSRRKACRLCERTTTEEQCLFRSRRLQVVDRHMRHRPHAQLQPALLDIKQR